MNKNEIYDFLNKHPIFQLATCDDNMPKVRHMMLYRADEDGLIFHTGISKDVCNQLLENNNVELCFLDIDNFMQIRVKGNAEIIFDDNLKEEIIKNPHHEHLTKLFALNKIDFFDSITIFKLSNCSALVWSIESNYDETKNYRKNYIEI